MSTPVCTVEAATPVSELRALMRQHRIRHLPVLATDGVLVGLVTYRDLLARAATPRAGDGPDDLVASRVMTSPAETVAPDTDLRAAAEVMLQRRFGCLPVVERGLLVGILTESDFVRLLSQDGS